MTVLPNSPCAWIGCLACYNDGRLVGEWFDAEGANEVTLAQVHRSAGRVRLGYEELWAFDHEHIPVEGELSPQDAAQWAEAINEVDDHLRPALFEWVRSGVV